MSHNRLHVIEGQLTPGSAGLASIRPGGSIAVVGSCFIDLIGYVPRLPGPGETLLSNSFQKGFGGKGANQAVMAAKLGAKVRMVSMVGKDGDGHEYVDNFKRNGVDTTFVEQVKGDNTGLAMISVCSKTAENSIVICPNVTSSFTAAHVAAKYPKSEFLDGVSLLICQNELPLATTLETLKAAHMKGIFTLLNTAPAPHNPDDIDAILQYLPSVSLLCPNETEATLFTGIEVKCMSSAIKAIKSIKAKGAQNVVMTLGSKGCLVAEGNDMPIHVPGVKVPSVVDTTGAGDCFVGSMSYFLAQGNSLIDACRKANVCAAQSVQKKGTQSSYPGRAELPTTLFQ